MGFDTNDRTVYDLLNDKMFIIAPNQRKYVWTQNNWRELIEDIDLVFQGKIERHFIGSVILQKEKIKDGIKNHYSVIDGQQRISTLTIMLCAMAYLYAENDMKDEFYGLEKQLFVTDNKRKSHPIVSDKANKSISSIVLSLFDIASEHFKKGQPLKVVDDFITELCCSKTITDCFKFFYLELKARTEGDLDILSSYREHLFDIGYIDIIAEEDEDAYNVFEVLNARGLPLTDFELLRNYLLRYTDNKKKGEVKEQIASLEGLLGSEAEMFLKHYAKHKYGVKTDRGENRPYKAIAKKSKENIDELLTDLLLKAKYYKKMTEYTDCTKLEKKVFSFFKTRRQQQFRPLVLGLMHQYELKKLSTELYEKYLEYLYEFFICYHIIGEQTSNKLEDIVDGYSYRIENAFSNDLLKSFQESMAARIPSETNFTNSIERLRYSHKFKAYSDNKKRDNVIAIYELLEKELGNDGPFDDMTIEHCNSDSDGEENAHIGNLILLEKEINEKRCAGKKLADKIECYNDSSLMYPKIIRSNFKRDGSIDYEKNAEFVAKKLYARISNVVANSKMPFHNTNIEKS